MGQPLDHFGPGRVAKLQLLDHIFGESRKQHEPPIVEGPREEPRVERIADQRQVAGGECFVQERLEGRALTPPLKDQPRGHVDGTGHADRAAWAGGPRGGGDGGGDQSKSTGRVRQRRDGDGGGRLHCRAPGSRRGAGLPAGLVGQAEACRGERARGAADDLEVGTHAQLPGDLVHAAFPVGECSPTAASERLEQIAATAPPGERGPELSFDRPAAERRRPAPFAHGDDHVGIDERAGEVHRTTSLVGREVGGGRFDLGIECQAARNGQVIPGLDPRFKSQPRPLEHRDIRRVDTGREEAVLHRRDDGHRLRHLAGHGDHHAVAWHDVGRERRSVLGRGDRLGDEPARFLAVCSGRRLEGRQQRTGQGFEHQWFIGAVVERGRVHDDKTEGMVRGGIDAKRPSYRRAARGE